MTKNIGQKFLDREKLNFFNKKNILTSSEKVQKQLLKTSINKFYKDIKNFDDDSEKIKNKIKI